MRGASCRAAARLSSSPRRRSRRHTWAYERRLRHLPAGSGAQRFAVGWIIGAAVAGAESDLRRDRCGMDLLRGAHHLGHVRVVLHARAVPLAAAARDARGDRHRRAAGADPAPVRDPPGALGRADQPAPGDRRRALLPAGRGDARLRHRVQEHRRHAGLGAYRRDVVLGGAADCLRRGAGRNGRDVSAADEDLSGHRDPRHQPGPRSDAADGRESRAHLCADLRARWRARRARFVPAGAAVRHPPGDRPLVRADHVPDLRARRPRQHGRRLRRGVHLCAVHRGRRLLLRARVGLCHRLRVLHRRDVLAAPGPVRKMNYPLHLAILVLLWGYIYTSWSVMGRLGLVSFGHGAFMGIGAYTVVMLWNHFGLTPWLGALAAFAFTAIVAGIIGYPCFRFKIVGHYFALVTLALSEVTRLIIIALRDQTGGSPGATPDGALHSGHTGAVGPTVGAAFTLLLAEGLRLAFGNRYPALDTTIYGVMLVLFIIYMPKGILGAALDAFKRRPT